MSALLQRATEWLYPPDCALCGAMTAGGGTLCAECWRGAEFLRGLCCDVCGTGLVGEGDGDELCDACLATRRPWTRGRAVLRYAGSGRRLVLALKHGDRLELAPAVAPWMAAAGRDVLARGTVLVPVPIARSRLLRRRSNQAAELARALARVTGLPFQPMALERVRATPSQDGLGKEERFANLAGAIRPGPGADLNGRSVTLIDDVMTSGATLAAATEAALDAGAASVSVLVLARVDRDA